MKSYLKHNHYLLLGTFIIACAQLMWEILYNHTPITFTNLEGELILKSSIWLLIIGIFLYKAAIGDE